MAAKNAALGIVGLVLLAGSLLLLWFVILSGLTDRVPLSLVYFLRADTSGITGARDVTQWTYFFFCGQDNNDCGIARPAPAFGKAWDSNAANVPSSLIGPHGDDTTSKTYFYLWRFGWVFFLISLFFQVLALFSGLLACCGRLGAAIASSLTFFALAAHTVAAALMTATFVKARDAFKADGRDASLGRYAFGFVWASWFLLFLALVIFCSGTRKTDHVSSGRRWGRQRSQRSVRRSYDGHRVKDDYS
ncbi:unnamed protein product [Clonostachys byssicola]|uniref:Protein SUR7 n=1 Tax=Clonostachys byssicola TaxID=160290 RepID=A0A9N9UQ82_9HYPO|nr:unnamed protein product [Clonostachys byssicola]